MLSLLLLHFSRPGEATEAVRPGPSESNWHYDICVCMPWQGQSGKETAALVDAVNKSGKAFMITTELSGHCVARFAIGGAQTQERHIRAAWQLILHLADRVLAKTEDTRS